MQLNQPGSCKRGREKEIMLFWIYNSNLVGVRLRSNVVKGEMDVLRAAKQPAKYNNSFYESWLGVFHGDTYERKRDRKGGSGDLYSVGDK